MILVIDNYDSFVYNLVRYLQLAGTEVAIHRNDETSIEECLSPDYEGLIISPGPKTPDQAGISLELIANWPHNRPLLGVCLGHQCLVNHFGGKTIKAANPMHGRSTDIIHTSSRLFHGLPNPMTVGRYHSLIGVLSPLKTGIRAVAYSEDNELMAIEHEHRPWYGVQFHPESVLTPQGRTMMDRFASICRSSAP